MREDAVWWCLGAIHGFAFKNQDVVMEKNSDVVNEAASKCLNIYATSSVQDCLLKISKQGRREKGTEGKYYIHFIKLIHSK